MKAGLLCPWTRQVHACLRVGVEKWGDPFGMTLEELQVQLGPLPFTRDSARGLLVRMVERGWLRAVREPRGSGRKGGSQVQVRYFAAADMPSERASVKSQSYFDGLVRACSVFELARVLGQQCEGGA